MGGGDEGEMPFVGDEVITENTQGYRVHGFVVGDHEAAGAGISGTKLPYRELATAITRSRKALALTKKRVGWRVGPRTDMDEVEAFSRSSTIARHIYEEARSSPYWVGSSNDPETCLKSSSLRRVTAGEHGYSGPMSAGPRPESPVQTRLELALRPSSSLAYLGDVDGDGIGDLAIGSPRDSLLGNKYGALWILLLDELGEVRCHTAIRGPAGRFLASMNEFAGLGTSVAPLGDLNGDGIVDLVVGAPHWDGGPEGQGGVWVLFLGRDGSIDGAIELGALESLQAAGVCEGYGLGESLATLGDLNGDGDDRGGDRAGPRLRPPEGDRTVSC